MTSQNEFSKGVSKAQIHNLKGSNAAHATTTYCKEKLQLKALHKKDVHGSWKIETTYYPYWTPWDCIRPLNLCRNCKQLSTHLQEFQMT